MYLVQGRLLYADHLITAALTVPTEHTESADGTEQTNNTDNTNNTDSTKQTTNTDNTNNTDSTEQTNINSTDSPVWALLRVFQVLLDMQHVLLCNDRIYLCLMLLILETNFCGAFKSVAWL